MNLFPILILGLVAVMMPYQTQAECSSTRPIQRVYVIRRRLSMLPGKYCSLAHSGLILQMTDRKECVLEYMGDGKSHLYDARPTRTWNCAFWRRCKNLKMKDDSGKTYTWTKQKYGTAWRSWKSSVTPQQAQSQMQSLMGSNYDLTTNNCHLGQERLRRKWGMSVPKPYHPNIRSVCSCKLPSWLPNTTLNTFLQLVRIYCARRG